MSLLLQYNYYWICILFNIIIIQSLLYSNKICVTAMNNTDDLNCIKTLNYINEQEQLISPYNYSNSTNNNTNNTKYDNELRIYILCPNTIYEIGTLTTSGKCCNDGYHPIELRSNTEYICGNDGNINNNCIITGGEFQLSTFPTTYNFESTTNVILKGFIFQSALVNGALFANKGNITFINCIFRVSII